MGANRVILRDKFGTVADTAWYVLCHLAIFLTLGLAYAMVSR